MKKIGVAAIAMACVFVASSADASQGYFGGRVEQDGLANVRRSTTEQFEPIRGQSVSQRARPDFDPTPINLSSFQLFPALNVASYYDSNIYTRQVANNDDIVWKIDPSLTAASNWGRHAIAFTGLADINQFTNSTTENFTSGLAQLEGRYDIAAQTWVAGNANYQRVTEPRSSTSVVGTAAEPTQYDVYSLGADAYRGVGALKATLGYDFNYRDYDPVALVGGGTASQNARNRTDHKVKGRVDYEVTQNLKPFVRGAFDWMDYTSASVRSSEGYGADVGAKMDFGGVTTAEAYVGYVGRNYYNLPSSGVNAVNFGGDVLWNVTELTSIEGEVSRQINETTFGGAKAYVTTGGSLTATHELTRSLIVEGNASFTNNDYKGISRSDDVYGVGAGARYFINRNFYSDLTYDFSKRTSNVPDSGFDRHTALVRFGAQY